MRIGAFARVLFQVFHFSFYLLRLCIGCASMDRIERGYYLRAMDGVLHGFISEVNQNRHVSISARGGFLVL